jgi:hypothetical protein
LSTGGSHVLAPLLRAADADHANANALHEIDVETAELTKLAVRTH